MNYYGKERYDFIQYWDDIRGRLRYASLSLVGTLRIESRAREGSTALHGKVPNTKHDVPIAVVRRLRVEANPDVNSVCALMQSVMHHVRDDEEGKYKLVLGSHLRCKSTAFLDTYNSSAALDTDRDTDTAATRCERDARPAARPSKWWFILRPSVFEGIETWS